MNARSSASEISPSEQRARAASTDSASKFPSSSRAHLKRIQRRDALGLVALAWRLLEAARSGPREP